MTTTHIVVSGQKFDTGSRVILWDEPGGLSLYSSKYGARNDSLEELRKKINCFVIHHAASYTAKSTYAGLIARGLSANFIIDDDDVDGAATIYQCLDVKDAGYSHKPLNFNGPGVEIAYQSEASTMPTAYSDDNIKKYNVKPHKIVEERIHGVRRRVFAPTDAQVNACIALAFGLSIAFPDMKWEFPKDAEGKVEGNVVSNPVGLVHHYMITRDKVDAAGFPSQKMENELKLRIKLGF